MSAKMRDYRDIAIYFLAQKLAKRIKKGDDFSCNYGGLCFSLTHFDENLGFEINLVNGHSFQNLHCKYYFSLLSKDELTSILKECLPKEL